MELLKTENLSKFFKGVSALTAVSLSVKEGEKKAIIGPNGAGKTTLINVITGVLPASTGKIYAMEHDITNMPMHRRTALGMARSFQVNSLFPDLSVLDNVIIALQGAHVTWHKTLRLKAFSRGYVDEAEILLRPTGLWEKRKTMVKELSHGEQRQVEIALSLASKPRILLLDEPSAGLTKAESAALVIMINSLSQDIAILFTAHDLDLVFTLATRILVLNQGKVFTEASPKEIREDAIVREIYLRGYSENA